MNRIYVILLISLFAMTGCEGNKQSAGDFITVDVTANYPKKEMILQDFMDVEYIPLETSDEFLTSAVMQAIGKEIMIFKNMNRGDGDIFIFNRNGKGLRKINRHGQGGEEYTNILGIVLDEENSEMFVNNHYSSKVIVYDLFGNFKRSFRQKNGVFYNQMGDYDQDNLICQDGFLRLTRKKPKETYF